MTPSAKSLFWKWVLSVFQWEVIFMTQPLNSTWFSVEAFRNFINRNVFGKWWLNQTEVWQWHYELKIENANHIWKNTGVCPKMLSLFTQTVSTFINIDRCGIHTRCNLVHSFFTLRSLQFFMESFLTKIIQRG